MPNALANYANAVLQFPVISDESTIDEFGNVLFKSEIIEISAFIKFKNIKDDNRLLQQSGGDVSEIWVEGYLVNPSKFPNGVRPSEIKIKFQGKNGVLKLRGLPHYLPVVEEYIGEKISGYIQFQVN